MKDRFRKYYIFTGLALLLLFVTNCTIIPIESSSETSDIAQLFHIEKTNQYAVGDVFVLFYNSIPNPEKIIGEPISHPFTNPENNAVTQYFENIRLETEIDLQGRVTIKVSNIGYQLFDPAGKSMVIIDENCTTLENSQIPLCHEFREFYDNQHGEILFGWPVSHVFQQNDRYYQYFENVCMIWDPITNAVSLAPLGDMYLTNQEPLRYTIIETNEPASMIIGSTPSGDMQLDYTVAHPFISPDWEQTVTILISDQNGKAIENATVTTWVSLPNGQFEIYRPMDTNQQGITSFTIHPLADTGVKHNDLIKMIIEVSVDGVSNQLIGWFRIWL